MPERRLSPELFQRIRLLLSSSATKASSAPPSSTSASTTTSFGLFERHESDFFLGRRFYFTTRSRNRGDTRQEIFRYVLHMRLYSRRMQRLVMSQVLKIERIVLKMSLKKRRLITTKSGGEPRRTHLQFVRIQDLLFELFNSRFPNRTPRDRP